MYVFCSDNVGFQLRHLRRKRRWRNENVPGGRVLENSGLEVKRELRLFAGN